MSYGIKLIEEKLYIAKKKMEATGEASYVADAVDELIIAIGALKDMVYELEKRS